MEMIEINVPWTEFGVISQEYLFHGNLTTVDGWCTPEVGEWISEYRGLGHQIEMEEYHVPWLTPETVAMRLEGVTFRFKDPTVATLFKLTWVGT